MKRYIRQESLKEIGKEGQEKIRKSSVAIIGIGAIGTVSSELLTRAGIGKLLLVDKDTIDLVNLQRQMLFDENDVGKSKVIVAKEKLSKINSGVNIEIKKEFLSKENANILDDYDLILDCTDNMKSRHLINDYCKNKYWIYAAAVGTKGNVLVVKDYEKFKNIFNSGETFDNCEEIGILNTVTTTIASLQVTEALKILVGKEPCKDLIRFNFWDCSYDKNPLE